MVNSGSSALMIAYDILPFKKGVIHYTCLNFSTTVGMMVRQDIYQILLIKFEQFCIDEDKLKSY